MLCLYCSMRPFPYGIWMSPIFIHTHTKSFIYRFCYCCSLPVVRNNCGEDMCAIVGWLCALWLDCAHEIAISAIINVRLYENRMVPRRPGADGRRLTLKPPPRSLFRFFFCFLSECKNRKSMGPEFYWWRYNMNIQNIYYFISFLIFWLIAVSAPYAKFWGSQFGWRVRDTKQYYNE